MTTSARTRIVLCEDHQMVREGLRALIDGEPDLEVVADASDGEQAIRAALDHGPDVVVMDIGLPLCDGIEATRRLRQQAPELPVVILSMHDDATTVDRALRAGARGYVLKGAGFARLCDAIRSVRRGEVYLSPDISDHVLTGYLRAGDGDPLSDREREILRLISDGHTSAAIARQLGLKPKTIENHRANIMDKLQIRTTAGLVRYALRSGVAR